MFLRFLQSLLLFLLASFITRISLHLLIHEQISFEFVEFLKIYSIGILCDILTFLYLFTALALLQILIPNRLRKAKYYKVISNFFYLIVLFILVFASFSEWFFFEEFQTRFNFITVDYLIYTQEVIGNIVESYPIGKLLMLILACTATIFLATRKFIVGKNRLYPLNSRVIQFCICLIFANLEFFTLDIGKIDKVFASNYSKEIAHNGIYQLFSAYRNNQIDYDQLYQSSDYDSSIARLRNAISKQEPKSRFLDQIGVERLILPKTALQEKKYNVVLVAMESMSADFMTYFGNGENITPNLDKIAKEGLFFTNMKATGTRTVRGLEALSLSIPPTPGNSIIRRPRNENLFNISTPLKERGYQAKFIYGGFGYFDNMNYFFANNGFEIVDRDNFSKEEISFSNSWGVSDEDLFDKVIAEADKSYGQGKQFLNFVMTTSNHRPFTYPDGKIDIESKTGRSGAVKYADYAVGQLLAKAKNKQWFKDTIFVFVSDHCAGSAGNTDVPVWRYQIPAIFYAPNIIKPQIFSENISQIDIAPTLFGMLNLKYKSKFFGSDVIANQKTLDQHSFVSTYSALGYLKNERLYLLKPKKQSEIFAVKLRKYGFEGSEETKIEAGLDDLELAKAISYYQIASSAFKSGYLKNNQENK